MGTSLVSQLVGWPAFLMYAGATPSGECSQPAGQGVGEAGRVRPGWNAYNTHVKLLSPWPAHHNCNTLTEVFSRRFSHHAGAVQANLTNGEPGDYDVTFRCSISAWTSATTGEAIFTLEYPGKGSEDIFQLNDGEKAGVVVSRGVGQKKWTRSVTKTVRLSVAPGETSKMVAKCEPTMANEDTSGCGVIDATILLEITTITRVP